MQAVSAQPNLQDINRALVARGKRQEGERLSRKDKKSVDQFRHLYQDVSEISKDPGVRSAVVGALGKAGGVPANPVLAQHLTNLRSKGSATDHEVAQIKTLAAHLSDDEDDAISATLAHLAIKGGMSKESVADISTYLDAERTRRGQVRTATKIGGGAAIVGTVLAAALAAPLLLWIGPLAPVVAGMGSAALQAVAMGTIAGGAAGGAMLGKKIGQKTASSAREYGVND